MCSGLNFKANWLRSLCFDHGLSCLSVPRNLSFKNTSAVTQDLSFSGYSLVSETVGTSRNQILQNSLMLFIDFITFYCMGGPCLFNLSHIDQSFFQLVVKRYTKNAFVIFAPLRGSFLKNIWQKQNYKSQMTCMI